MHEQTSTGGASEQTTDTARHARHDTTQRQGQNRTDDNLVSNVAVGASGGLITLIDATETVLEGAVHAVGRLGTAAVDEVFGLITTITGGISETATSMFQGRRMPTRSDRRDRGQHDTSAERAGTGV